MANLQLVTDIHECKRYVCVYFCGQALLPEVGKDSVAAISTGVRNNIILYSSLCVCCNHVGQGTYRKAFSL